MSEPHRIAYLVTHPIQYQAPLLRFLSADPRLELTALFLSDVSTRPHRDRGFGATVHWDVPLLDGYRHEFLEPVYRTSRINFLEPVTRDVEGRLASGGFDTLWVHGWFHQAALRAMRAARARGMRVLLRGESTVHRKGLARFAAEAVQRRVLALADGFLAIGTRNREFYRHHGVPADLVFDVPYAVDNELFAALAGKAAGRREELRAALGLEAGRPVVLYASKLSPRKRPMDLLRAYERLSRGGREPEPYLLFAGDGSERERLEVCAAANGWRSVRFLGFQNQTELPALYDLCDVFVLPSAFEPWGLVVNEVMNAARPVIASDAVGAGPDLVLDGETGWTYPAGDERALAERLEDALADAGRRRALGAAARERVSAWDFARDRDGLVRALGGTAARRAA